MTFLGWDRLFGGKKDGYIRQPDVTVKLPPKLADHYTFNLEKWRKKVIKYYTSGEGSKSVHPAVQYIKKYCFKCDRFDARWCFSEERDTELIDRTEVRHDQLLLCATSRTVVMMDKIKKYD